MTFTAALLQMQVVGGAKQQNLRHAREMIDEAAAQGADLVVLPEAMNLGWTHPSARQLADPIPGGPSCRALQEAALANKVFVCAGLIEQDGEKVFNAAVLIDRSGQVRLRHRKLNELAIAHDFYAQGSRLNVCSTELGTLGLHICADGFAQHQTLSRSLCYMGADVILSPSAWAVPADHDHVQTPYGELWQNVYQPVAQTFKTWIIGVSNVGYLTRGPWAGRKCIGCSLVVGPEGREQVKGPYGPEAETILYTDITPVKRPARGDEWAGHAD